MPRKAKATKTAKSTKAVTSSAQTSAKTTSVTTSAVSVDDSPSWVLIMFQGVLTLLLGWLLLARPVSSTFALVQILGLFWLIGGVISIVQAVVHREQQQGWGWSVASGLIGIIAGLVILNNKVLATVITPTILLYFIAFTFMIDGGVRMFVGKKSGDESGYKRSFGTFLAGLFYIVMGMALLFMPLAAALSTLVIAIGLLAVTGGIFLIISSFQVRQLQKTAASSKASAKK